MSVPSIRKTAAFSAALHAALFLLSFLILRHSSQMELPSPYIVSLVGADISGRQAAGGAVSETTQSAERDGVSVEKDAERRKEETAVKEDKKEERRIQDRLSELRAIKKLQKLAGLRKAIIDIKGGGGKPGPRQPSKGGSGTGGQGGSAPGGYVDKITSEIHEYWAIPDTMDKTLTAVVSVKILRDGTILILGMEKSSGNRVFDALAQKAILKAQPVSPPPQEMEMGIRFYP